MMKLHLKKQIKKQYIKKKVNKEKKLNHSLKCFHELI